MASSAASLSPRGVSAPSSVAASNAAREQSRVVARAAAPTQHCSIRRHRRPRVVASASASSSSSSSSDRQPPPLPLSIGFDLGTANSSVAVFRDGGPEIVPDTDSGVPSVTTPSWVAVDPVSGVFPPLFFSYLFPLSLSSHPSSLALFHRPEPPPPPFDAENPQAPRGPQGQEAGPLQPGQLVRVREEAPRPQVPLAAARRAVRARVRRCRGVRRARRGVVSRPWRGLDARGGVRGAAGAPGGQGEEERRRQRRQRLVFFFSFFFFFFFGSSSGFEFGLKLGREWRERRRSDGFLFFFFLSRILFHQQCRHHGPG